MSKKILLIDDDIDFREAISTLLEAKGYGVITARNGKEGFSKAVDEDPDLILLDVMMDSKTEGFEIARKIRSESSIAQVPILIATGIRQDMSLPFGFEPDSKEMPVEGIIEKPVKPKELLAAVKKHIRKK